MAEGALDSIIDSYTRQMELNVDFNTKLVDAVKDSSTQNKLDQGARSERDKKNYEYFKKKHGEYPDIMWKKLYPEQFKRPWKPFL